ncbi:adenine phosphoribosyltransferase [Candidatus Pacearchaeota archaeon]|nr:adenine phosphoribosyltransferase [Candidatus Pacearchaeota archaeon]
MNIQDIKKRIRTIPHFPKKGIMFRDITPLLQDPFTRRYVLLTIEEHFKDKRIDAVVAAESRGFIFGSILAHEMYCSFVPLRKPGKLPYKTIKQEFQTEYSIDAFEMHEDGIKKGQNVLIADDLLATGGTAEAACKLVERLGGNVVGVAFIIDLSYLGGREKLKKYDVFSVIDYKSEEEDVEPELLQ